MRPTIALLPLVAALMIGGCDRQSDSAQQPAERSVTANQVENSGSRPEGGLFDRSHAGTAAPALPFKDAEGKHRTVADFAGKPILLNLWATWCAPCVKEMPTLDALAVAKGDALHVLTISQDLKGAEVVAPYFAEAKFKKLQPYLDTDIAWSMTLGANLPMTILYDSSGKEVWRVAGDFDWHSPEALKLIEEAK